MSDWLPLPFDPNPADPEQMATCRQFFLRWLSDEVTEQALVDRDLSAADLESMLRLLEDKVLHVWSADKVVAIARAIVRRAEVRPVD